MSLPVILTMFTLLATMKIPIVSGLVSGVVLFFELNRPFTIGRLINIIVPCEQNPMNSFPCFGKYDVYFMFLLVLIIAASIMAVIIQAYKNKT
jgi:hypothetical protein